VEIIKKIVKNRNFHISIDTESVLVVSLSYSRSKNDIEFECVPLISRFNNSSFVFSIHITVKDSLGIQ